MITWTAHSYCSDPGPHGLLLRDLSAGAAAACAAARNVIGHYGTDFPVLRAPQRDEVNCRTLGRILAVDQARHHLPLDTPRVRESRVAGCCRDHSLFVVGALREQGIPARTRVGFADYLVPDRRIDHVIAEYRQGGDWIRTDPEMRPGAVAFDPADLDFGPEAPFQTAAEAWQLCRGGSARFDRYQVPPGSEFTGPDHLLRTYVALELAHRNRDELLLWDTWPGLQDLDDKLVDEIADLLIIADSGDPSAEAALAGIYLRCGPGDVVTQLSPHGDPPQQVRIRS